MWVSGIADTVEWMLRTPVSRAALLLVVLLALILGGTIADRLGWRRWGTRLALAGFGAALVPTFVSRIGYYDFSVNLRAIDDCLGGISQDWAAPEGVLNLVLLAPTAIGLVVASRNYPLSATLVVAVAIGIELGQSVTGLGVCQRGDMVRNGLGGLIAVGATWLVVRRFGTPQVTPERRPPRGPGLQQPLPTRGRRW